MISNKLHHKLTVNAHACVSNYKRETQKQNLERSDPLGSVGGVGDFHDRPSVVNGELFMSIMTIQ